MTTPNGNYVLSNTGSRIHLDNDEFTIDGSGQVAANGRPVSALGVAYAADPNALIKEGNGLFRMENGQALLQAVTNANVKYSLRQGSLERSNVDASRSMTDMMTAYRAFEANQKVLQAYDRSADKMVNQIGRV